jgi:hypothetical protein
MTDKDREAFEAWDREVFALPDRYYAPLYEGDFPSIDVKARWKAWQAATADERERAARVCEAYAIDQHALYKGKPPYTGKEPGRYSPYTEGLRDGADVCADKIRSGE